MPCIAWTAAVSRNWGAGHRGLLHHLSGDPTRCCMVALGRGVDGVAPARPHFSPKHRNPHLAAGSLRRPAASDRHVEQAGGAGRQ
ncbi:hypothetical protein ACFQU2_36925 [Siccirubricoccus deserti]